MNRKKIISVILTLLLLLACVTACQAASPGQTTDSETSQAEEMTGNEMQSEPDPAAGEETMIYAHIGDKTLTIKPESNSSARAFVELLQSGGLTVDMHDYGGLRRSDRWERHFRQTMNVSRQNRAMLSFIRGTRSRSTMIRIPGVSRVLEQYRGWPRKRSGMHSETGIRQWFSL